ncbi:hypothetical protein A2803_03065 [Candidatus Woesebacteria bacterium RIFCSPHIGHO2_01_FULL_44_21]|uniref:Uncharacterized protein n=1 Tax=Candidatus Woesebacteria bacterium RIFCSPHIGHO2_01_FULL_44_21 TaxID=1802503 RepID=A0A1F7Z0G4_9BACT|nr:MAG: hypothetical protein A2803_03065 [Candidatus Woesebacteria bacterium RIFCSPHIGHO2_01_FULL_44_21]OGM69204.1 MAG: hypothetical protein A2897_04315 [Candidatus Woesebacteria bacterium RIFCSPLOWO2_01_FULL_44_24b]
MADINLLPKESGTSKKVDAAQVLLKKISLALGVIFLLVVGVLGGFYFISYNNLNGLKAKHEDISAQVQGLQSTEASLVFLKDRLQKAQTVLASRTNESYLAKQRAILQNAPEAIVFKESTIDVSASNLEVETASSSQLVSLMSTIMASSDFSSLVIGELSFNVALGYSILFQVF